MKISDQTKQSRAPKGFVKNKNAKAPSSSGVHAGLVNKSKIRKDKETPSSVSNGTLALDSRPKQSIKSSRSFNDRQTEFSNPKVNSLFFVCQSKLYYYLCLLSLFLFSKLDEYNMLLLILSVFGNKVYSLGIT